MKNQGEKKKVKARLLKKKDGNYQKLYKIEQKEDGTEKKNKFFYFHFWCSIILNIYIY